MATKKDPSVPQQPVYRGDTGKNRVHTYNLLAASRFTAGATDHFFFIFAGVAAGILTWFILQAGFQHSWLDLLLIVIFWVVTAYLTLPRLHAIFTKIYVPDYFIGRTRTPDGLLADPVNLGFCGSEEQLHQGMQSAGWTLAEDITLKSSWGIVLSTLSKRSYPQAPVSSLKLFGRQQDFTYQQEVDGNPKKRHHVRFWKTPDGWLLPGGHRVDWLAAGTYDTGVGFSFFTFQITHRIDADTDSERDYIVETLQYAQPETEVQVIKDFSTGYHARNGGGDSIVTDGDLPILIFHHRAHASQRKQDPLDLHSARDIAQKLPMNVLIGSVMVVLWACTQCARMLYEMKNPLSLHYLVSLEPSIQEAVQLLGAEELLEILQVLLPVVIIIFTVVQLLLAWRLLKKSGRARLLSLDLLALSFIFHLVRTWAWGQELALTTILGPMTVLVFAMLAYTSDQAREYTEANQGPLAARPQSRSS